MKLARLPLILLCMIAMFGFGHRVSAQDGYAEYMEMLASVDTAYKQDYYAKNQFAGTPETVAWTLPAISVGVNVFPDVRTADIWMEYFNRLAMNENGDVEIIDDMGDEGFRLVSMDSEIYSESVFVRDGAVVFYANTTPLSPHLSLGEDMIRFMVEHGPGEAPISVAVDGTISGGWIDAYPTQSDLPELSDYDAPVVSLTSYPHSDQATPVSQAD